jgi:hypothetical protein
MVEFNMTTNCILRLEDSIADTFMLIKCCMTLTQVS